MPLFGKKKSDDKSQEEKKKKEAEANSRPSLYPRQPPPAYPVQGSSGAVGQMPPGPPPYSEFAPSGVVPPPQYTHAVPPGIPVYTPIDQPVTDLFEAGARFDVGSRPVVPPPPPGYTPNRAQQAVAQGQSVNMGQRPTTFWGGTGESGYTVM